MVLSKSRLWVKKICSTLWNMATMQEPPTQPLRTTPVLDPTPSARFESSQITSRTPKSLFCAIWPVVKELEIVNPIPDRGESKELRSISLSSL